MAVAALALVVLAGCTPAAEVPEPQAPPSTPETPPTPGRPVASPGAGTVDTSGVGTSGLNIRYLDKDGKTRTLEVKDFDR